MKWQRSLCVTLGLWTWLMSLGLLAQPLPSRKRPAPVTGLKVTGAQLDRSTGQVTVHLQNLTNRTVVAYILQIPQFDAAGKEIGDANFSGIGYDWAGPEPNPSASHFIPAGRGVAIMPVTAAPEALSVEARVIAVIYDDQTWEGLAQAFFQTRADRARELRSQAAALGGDKKSEREQRDLERQATWFESHGPKEEAQ